MEEAQEDQQPVTVTLSRDEALVLFECLSQLDQHDELRFQDQAELRVLWDLLASLEQALDEPLRADYVELVAAARDRVRDPT